MEHDHSEKVTLVGLASRLGRSEAEIASARDDIKNVRNDVAGVKLEIGARFEGLMTTLEGMREKGTNWPAIGTAMAGMMTVVGGIFFAFINPIYSEQTRQYEALEKITETQRQFLTRFVSDDQLYRLEKEYGHEFDEVKAKIDDRIPRKEHEEFKQRLDHDRDSLQKQIDDNRSYIRNLDSELIKRPEINALDTNLAQQNENLRLRIDQIQAQINSVYTWGDNIKQQQQELQDLRTKIYQLILNQPNQTIIQPQQAPRYDGQQK